MRHRQALQRCRRAGIRPAGFGWAVLAAIGGWPQLRAQEKTITIVTPAVDGSAPFVLSLGERGSGTLDVSVKDSPGPPFTLGKPGDQWTLPANKTIRLALKQKNGQFSRDLRILEATTAKDYGWAWFRVTQDPPARPLDLAPAGSASTRFIYDSNKETGTITIRAGSREELKALPMSTVTLKNDSGVDLFFNLNNGPVSFEELSPSPALDKTAAWKLEKKKSQLIRYPADPGKPNFFTFNITLGSNGEWLNHDGMTGFERFKVSMDAGHPLRIEPDKDPTIKNHYQNLRFIPDESTPGAPILWIKDK